MVDYEFYAQQYLGSRIKEAEFPPLEALAAQYLRKIKRCCHVSSPAPESEKMAVCAMAEALWDHEKNRSGVHSASIGSVRVQYDPVRLEGRSLERELYRRACIYLDVYRGIG